MYVVRSSILTPNFDKKKKKTPEEGRRTHRSKRCEYKNKDEDNRPKILNDKNHQASSKKNSDN